MCGKTFFSVCILAASRRRRKWALKISARKTETLRWNKATCATVAVGAHIFGDGNFAYIHSCGKYDFDVAKNLNFTKFVCAKSREIAFFPLLARAYIL